MSDIRQGDRVRCLRGNIDKNIGEGLIGIVEGFSRFSAYHGREAFVRFDDVEVDGLRTSNPANGWFWVNNVERV